MSSGLHLYGCALCEVVSSVLASLSARPSRGSCECSCTVMHGAIVNLHAHFCMTLRGLCWIIMQRHAQAADALGTTLAPLLTFRLHMSCIVHGDVLHHRAQALEALGNHTDAFLDLQRLRAAAPSYPGIAELLRLAAGRALRQQSQARPCQVHLLSLASAAPLPCADCGGDPYAPLCHMAVCIDHLFAEALPEYG